MIDKQYGRFELSCDVCGDTAEETFDDFDEAMASFTAFTERIEEIWNLR